MIQHFISSSHAIYIVVVSLHRETTQQTKYWMNFLSTSIDKSKSHISIVGTKSDLVKETDITKFVKYCTDNHNVTPLCVSAETQTGIKAFRKEIESSGERLLKAQSYEFSLQHRQFLLSVKNSSKLVFASTSLPNNDFWYLHNLGEIICTPRESASMWICTKPKILARLMGMFVCPEIHEHALLNFVEELKRPRYPIIPKAKVYEQISSFLKLDFIQAEYALANDVTSIDEIVQMLVKLDFMYILDKGVETHYMLPTLRPFGTFRWNYDKASLKKTLGRRLVTVDGSHFQSFWFFNLQVSFV